MHTKNSRIINILISSLLVITTSISVGFYFSRPQATILVNHEATQQILAEKPAKAVTQQDVNQGVLFKTQNDVTVKITSTKMISTGVEIGICYTAPDNGEWRPLPSHLFYNKYEVFPDEIEFLANEILADGKNTGTRCALVRYHIDDLNTITTPIEFSVLKFYAPGREMYTPCEELQQRLETNPKAQAYGLKAKCTETGDGNISVMLTSYDKSLVKDKASKMLDEIVEAEIVGPWEFTLNKIER